MAKDEFNRDKKQFWTKMDREKKTFWKKLANESAKAASRGARSHSMTGQGNGPPWVGCAVLFGILSILSAILSIIEAIERAVYSIFKLVGIALASVVGLYLASLLLVLILGPLADWIRQIFTDWQRRQAALAAVRNSPFPRQHLLQDERHLDSIIWRMIDFHLGQETAQIRHQFGLVESKNRRIAEQTSLREILLSDREVFETWKHDHMAEVLRNPYNRPTLTGIYNTILKRARNEARGIEKPTELLEIVGFTIMRDPTPLPRLYLTQQGLKLLTWGRMCNDAQGTDLLAVGEAETSSQIKVRSYLTNSERFREFMERYFFEIMGEMEFEAHLPKVHRVYRRDQEQQKHYTLLPASNRGQRLLPRKTQTAEDAAELEVHKQRSLELTRKAKARAEHTKTLRKKYLGSRRSRPRVVFRLFKEGKSGLEDDVREHLLEWHAHDSEKATDAFDSLRLNRTEFVTFWKAHEADILEAHDDRMTAEALLTPEQEQQQWVEQTIPQALTIHRSEQDRMKTDGDVTIDPEYGYLLAAARQRVRQQLRDPSIDGLENFLQRELLGLLSVADARRKYFGDAIRRALHDCQQFRQGTLFYGDQLHELGYVASAERDSLVLAFVLHAARWRDEQQTSETAIPVGSPIASESTDGTESRDRQDRDSRPTSQDDSVSTPPATMVLAPKPPEALLTTKEAAELLGASPRTLESWRTKGTGPPIAKITDKMVRYRVKDLFEWTERHLRKSTSDPGDGLKK